MHKLSEEIDIPLSVVRAQEQTVNYPAEPQVKLRNALFSDFSFIGRLSREVFSVYGPYEDILTRWFRSGDEVTTIIACLDKIQIGFAMLSEPSDRYNLYNVSELLGIAVEPGRQGKGIGSRLLGAIESRSAAIGIKWLFLHTAIDNIPARGLYEKTGYRNLELKRNFYPEGQDAIVMYKSVVGHTAGKLGG
jgi:[ribosomal protein S18]-alanine N-acetyltransferase